MQRERTVKKSPQQGSRCFPSLACVLGDFFDGGIEQDLRGICQKPMEKENPPKPSRLPSYKCVLWKPHKIPLALAEGFRYNGS